MLRSKSAQVAAIVLDTAFGKNWVTKGSLTEISQYDYFKPANWILKNSDSFEFCSHFIKICRVMSHKFTVTSLEGSGTSHYSPLVKSLDRRKLSNTSYRKIIANRLYSYISICFIKCKYILFNQKYILLINPVLLSICNRFPNEFERVSLAFSFN